jgi:hypothetical protein
MVLAKVEFSPSKNQISGSGRFNVQAAVASLSLPPLLFVNAESENYLVAFSDDDLPAEKSRNFSTTIL